MKRFNFSFVLSQVLLANLTFSSCTLNNKEEVDEGNKVTEFEHKSLLYINHQIDSAYLVYVAAVNDAKNGESDEVILKKYELLAARHHQNIAKAIKEVTSTFKKLGKTQQEYEVFLSKIDPKKVKQLSAELAGLGITFDLDRDSL